jgi:hypothetical protein
VEERHGLLDEKRAADYLNVSMSLLRRLRREGVGPKAIKISRLVRYPVEGLDAWIKAQGS